MWVTEVIMNLEVNSEVTSDVFKAAQKAQNDKTASEGLEAITFEGAEGEKWLTAARDAAWAEVLERSPETGAELKKLFTK